MAMNMEHAIAWCELKIVCVPIIPTEKVTMNMMMNRLIIIDVVRVEDPLFSINFSFYKLCPK